jgi:mRNA-capping enzyme
VIDLTNTDRFYKSDVEFKDKKVRYEKIRCRGHGETPNDEQINLFISICNEFSTTNPDDIIGVHCTHGFNRTGFLISVYLCRESDMSIDAAIDIFSKARSPGIYKQDYLNELLRKYGDESSVTINAPVRPEWCNTNSDDEDEPNERPVGVKRPLNNIFELPNKRIREEPQNSNPQFAVSLPGVTPVCLQSAMTAIQLKCQRMCEWNG